MDGARARSRVVRANKYSPILTFSYQLHWWRFQRSARLDMHNDSPTILWSKTGFLDSWVTMHGICWRWKYPFPSLPFGLLLWALCFFFRFWVYFCSVAKYLSFWVRFVDTSTCLFCTIARHLHLHGRVVLFWTSSCMGGVFLISAHLYSLLSCTVFPSLSSSRMSGPRDLLPVDWPPISRRAVQHEVSQGSQSFIIA
jgi:hypothetical protein